MRLEAEVAKSGPPIWTRLPESEKTRVMTSRGMTSTVYVSGTVEGLALFLASLILECRCHD